MMEKEVRRFKVDFNFDWTYGVEIKKLKEDIEALEKLGATHVELESSVSYDTAYITIGAYVNRIETDKEYKARIDKQNQRQEDIKRRELAELEKLKLKYGG